MENTRKLVRTINLIVQKTSTQVKQFKYLSELLENIGNYEAKIGNCLSSVADV